MKHIAPPLSSNDTPPLCSHWYLLHAIAQVLSACPLENESWKRTKYQGCQSSHYQNTPLFLQTIRLPAGASSVVINMCKAGTLVRKKNRPTIKVSPNSARRARQVLNQKLKMKFLEQMSLQLGQRRDPPPSLRTDGEEDGPKQKLNSRRPQESAPYNPGFKFKYLNRTQSPRCGWTSWKPEGGGWHWAPHCLSKSN